MQAVQTKAHRQGQTTCGTVQACACRSAVTSQQAQRMPAYTRGLGRAVQLQVAVGKPDDTYEQEADAVARRVTAGQNVSANPISRLTPGALAPKRDSVEPPAQPAKDIEPQAPPLSPQSDESAMHSAPGDGGSASQQTAAGQAIAERGAGRPMHAATRHTLETRMGRDFSDVRIHDDTRAQEAARSLGARAFTHQNHIWLGQGESDTDLRLMAHELTHTIQQQGEPGVQRCGATGCATAERCSEQTPMRRPEKATEEPAAAANIQRQPTRDAAGANGGGGQIVVQRDDAPASDPLDARLNDEIAGWTTAAQDQTDPLEAAYAQRVVLLLTLTRPDTLADDAALTAFIEEAVKAAETEFVTLARITSSETVLDNSPQAFPDSWGQRVLDALSVEVDEKVVTDRDEKLVAVKNLGERVPPVLMQKGLPVDFETALKLEKYSLEPKAALIEQDHIVRDFARAGWLYARAGALSVFFVSWNSYAKSISDSVKSGELSVDYTKYMDFDSKKQSRLDSIAELAPKLWTDDASFSVDSNTQDALSKTVRELAISAYLIAPLSDPVGGLIPLLVAAGITIGASGRVLFFWETVKQEFARRIAETDKQIQHSSKSDRLWQAEKWAHANGYFDASVSKVVDSLLADAPGMALKMGAFAAAQAIPVVNVIVDLWLLFDAASDSLDAAEALKAASEFAASASFTEQMQQASAMLALSEVSDGLKLVLSLIQIKQSAKALGKHFNSGGKTPTLPENQAGENEPKNGEDRNAKDRTKDTSEPDAPGKPTLPGKLAALCVIGSINCGGGIPAKFEEEVGDYPHPERCPKPTGAVELRGLKDSSYVALRKVTGKALRAIYEANPKLWTKEFREAYENADKKWPTENGRKWQVHHRKPLDYGGDNHPGNLVALEPSVHVKFTTWWGQIKWAFWRELGDAEKWDKLIGGEVTETYTEDEED